MPCPFLFFTLPQSVPEDIIQKVISERVRCAPNLEVHNLNFLRVICGSRERPVRRNQDWISSDIVEKGNVLFQGIYVHAMDTNTWIIKIMENGIEPL